MFSDVSLCTYLFSYYSVNQNPYRSHHFALWDADCGFCMISGKFVVCLIKCPTMGPKGSGVIASHVVKFDTQGKDRCCSTY